MHHTPVYSFPWVPPTTTTFRTFVGDVDDVGDDDDVDVDEDDGGVGDEKAEDPIPAAIESRSRIRTGAMMPSSRRGIIAEGERQRRHNEGRRRFIAIDERASLDGNIQAKQSIERIGR